MIIKIVQLERNTDGVVVVHWTAEKTLDGLSAQSHGSESFVPDPNKLTYIPYDSLTEADVASWLNATAIEEELNAQIRDANNPSRLVGVPW